MAVGPGQWPTLFPQRPQSYWAVRLDGSGKIVIAYRAVGEELVQHIDLDVGAARGIAKALENQLFQIDNPGVFTP